eukprot:10772919-Lingulodinium_polyedra.AAC.1
MSPPRGRFPAPNHDGRRVARVPLFARSGRRVFPDHSVPRGQARVGARLAFWPGTVRIAPICIAFRAHS